MVRPRRQDGPLREGRGRGFSLVELIVVIVITGVIASVVGLFIAGPIQGFLDQSRRAELVDAAQIALTRMGRDLRGALPNSVRVDPGGNAIEILLATDGDRYRGEVPGTAADRLEFAAADDAFNTLSPLSPPSPVPALGVPYVVSGALAIYPLQQSGADPYVATDRVMTPGGNIQITPVANSGVTEYRVVLNAAGGPGAHQFPFDSPTRRVFLVSGPVSYLCDAGELLRYDGYGVQSGQAATRAAFAALIPAPAATLVVKDVQSCAFQYSAGTAQRNAVVSVALVLAKPDVPDERVRLVRQVHVSNSP